tara:strand:- start:604 stop:789 length:186 start_codon:yes stop_codon:yes gene_type:complete
MYWRIKMSKEKEAIMKVLQSYGLKQANLTSEFAREEIADEILKAQKEVWTKALSEMGLELK